MKIRDVNKKSNAIPSNSTAVDRIFGGAQVVRKDVMETSVTQSGRSIFDVPLSMIRARPVNNYAIADIPQLAESICKTGLWQPIILRRDERPDDERIYVIVAGERRYTAMTYLKEQAEQAGDNISAKLYSSIAAIILSPDDEEKEEDIYRDTNDYARQITNFERIMRLDPNSIDLSKESWQERYVEACLGPEKVADYHSGKIKVKGNLSEKCQYIIAVLTKKEPDLDISESTVRVYLNLLDRMSETLRQAILKGIVPLREAQSSISWLSEDDQRNAVDAVGTDMYQRYVEEGKELSGSAKRETRTNTAEPEGLITAATRISKKLYSTKKLFDKIYADATYRRDLDEAQKKYIAQLREAMQAIERLERAEAAMKAEKKNSV